MAKDRNTSTSEATPEVASAAEIQGGSVATSATSAPAVAADATAGTDQPKRYQMKRKASGAIDETDNVKIAHAAYQAGDHVTDTKSGKPLQDVLKEQASAKLAAAKLPRSQRRPAG